MVDVGLFIWLPIVITIIAIIYAFWLRSKIMEQSRGTPSMIEVSDAIKEGSIAFLKKQYSTIFIIGTLLGVLILLFLDWNLGSGFKLAAPLNAFAFLIGVTFSLISGAVAMLMAAESNSRTTFAATESTNKALNTAYRGGLVMGLLVVSMSILGITLLYLFYTALGNGEVNPISVIAFGFGASFAALFAQLGGGIFTKAADVGADLAGKLEAGIPEDDIRNPGVIADNVGDAVGDCAGRGADLFESVSGETIGGMIVGLTFYLAFKDSANPQVRSVALAFVIFPLIANSVTILGTMASSFFVNVDEEGKKTSMDAMKVAFYITAIINFVLLTGLVVLLFGSYWQFIAAVFIGILLAVVTLWATEYYTSDKKKPVRSIADASTTGPATNIIAGLSVGMSSTWAPMLGIVTAVMSTFWLGVSFAKEKGPLVVAFADHYNLYTNGNINQVAYTLFGVFAITIGTMSMLSVTPIILAMDGYGPIADQSGGIAEMSDAEPEVRERIDALDAVGNTTKALAKGYGMTSAGLAALLLFQAYLEDFGKRVHTGNFQLTTVNLADPNILAGLFVGALLPFVFTSMSMGSVGRAANEMVKEIRRQFKEIPGIMEHKNKPDYAACIDVSTGAALREMRNPSLLVVLLTIVVGFLLGPIPLAAYLIGATSTGILLGLTLNNGGGAWDNAKKLIESGLHGGKGSPAHHAAVVGDTVGDPSKDTSGPAIHVLIKLINTIALTLLPLFLVYNGILKV